MYTIVLLYYTDARVDVLIAAVGSSIPKPAKKFSQPAVSIPRLDTTSIPAQLLSAHRSEP